MGGLAVLRADVAPVQSLVWKIVTGKGVSHKEVKT